MKRANNKLNTKKKKNIFFAIQMRMENPPKKHVTFMRAVNEKKKPVCIYIGTSTSEWFTYMSG